MTARGRPKKDLAEKKSGNISTRLRGDLRGRLEKEAREAGRTLSDEIARRLVRSFSEDERLMERVGGPENLALLMLIAESLKDLHSITMQPWHRDRFTFDHAVAAVGELLSYFRPEGRAKAPTVAWVEPGFPYGANVARKAVVKLETPFNQPDTRPERAVYQRIAKTVDEQLTRRSGPRGGSIFGRSDK